MKKLSATLLIALLIASGTQGAGAAATDIASAPVMDITGTGSIKPNIMMLGLIEPVPVISITGAEAMSVAAAPAPWVPEAMSRAMSNVAESFFISCSDHNDKLVDHAGTLDPRNPGSDYIMDLGQRRIG